MSYYGTSEIISVETSTVATCPSVPDFPKLVFGSAGTLIQQKIPLVCSGYDERVSCYLLKGNVWQQTGNLNQPRYRSAMLPRSPFQNPTHEAIIIGGFDSVNTMEVFNGTSWTIVGPTFAYNHRWNMRSVHKSNNCFPPCWKSRIKQPLLKKYLLFGFGEADLGTRTSSREWALQSCLWNAEKSKQSHSKHHHCWRHQWRTNELCGDPG